LGRLIKDIVTELVGKDLAHKVWSRLELIGDIAVIRKSPEVSLDMLKLVAEELLRRLPYVRSVWAAVTPVTGAYRTREYVHLAGERRSLTIYKEHGCQFYVDITKVYISPVLSYEHMRIARMVREGEYVINMFAGVGLFSIIIARHARPSKVVSIDINPYAYELMIKNISMNHVEGVVEPVLGDAGEVISNYSEIADRVLMPLPELAFKYFPKAVNALKNSGFIHVYEFELGRSKEEAIDKVVNKYLIKAVELGVSAEVTSSRVVRSVGPRRYQVVLDMRITS